MIVIYFIMLFPDFLLIRLTSNVLMRQKYISLYSHLELLFRRDLSMFSTVTWTIQNHSDLLMVWFHVDRSGPGFCSSFSMFCILATCPSIIIRLMERRFVYYLERSLCILELFLCTFHLEWICLTEVVNENFLKIVSFYWSEIN